MALITKTLNQLDAVAELDAADLLMVQRGEAPAQAAPVQAVMDYLEQNGVGAVAAAEAVSAADVAAAARDLAQSAAAEAVTAAQALGMEVDTTGTIFEADARIMADPKGWVVARFPKSGAPRLVGDGKDPELTFRSVTKLPSGAQGENPGGGWTCTGGVLLPPSAGELALCPAIANDGRATTGHAVFRCSIVILNRARDQILRELRLDTPDFFDPVAFPNKGSAQGLAWRKADGTFYWTDKSNRILRHVAAVGVPTGLPADDPEYRPYRFNAVKLPGEIPFPHPTSPPNALCAIDEEDALFAPGEGGATNIGYVFSCATGAIIRQFPVRGDIDHAFHRDGLLFCSYGGNGVEGLVDVMDAQTGAVLHTFSGLRYAEAIEGLWIDGSVMTVVVDAGFHGGTLPWNMLIDYELKLGELGVPAAGGAYEKRAVLESMPGADYSERNLGFFNPEPQPDLPNGLTDRFRLKRDLTWSLSNLAGGPRAVANGADLEVKEASVGFTSTGYATVPGRHVTAPGTIIAVIRQPPAAPATARLLAGTGRNSGADPLAGMIHSGASNNYLATVRRPTGVATSTAGLAAVGGERWEMLAVTFDNVANQLRLYRPRTGDERVVACTDWPAVVTDCRLGSGGAGTYSGAHENAEVQIYAGTILTKAQIDEVFAAMTPVLASDPDFPVVIN